MLAVRPPPAPRYRLVTAPGGSGPPLFVIDQSVSLRFLGESLHLLPNERFVAAGLPPPPPPAPNDVAAQALPIVDVPPLDRADMDGFQWEINIDALRVFFGTSVTLLDHWPFARRPPKGTPLHTNHVLLAGPWPVVYVRLPRQITLSRFRHALVRALIAVGVNLPLKVSVIGEDDPQAQATAPQRCWSFRCRSRRCSCAALWRRSA